MSNGSLAPSAAFSSASRVVPSDGAASPEVADPALRFQRRVSAELALRDLERSVARLARRLEPQPCKPTTPPRRATRASAWWSIG